MCTYCRCFETTTSPCSAVNPGGASVRSLHAIIPDNPMPDSWPRRPSKSQSESSGNAEIVPQSKQLLNAAAEWSLHLQVAVLQAALPHGGWEAHALVARPRRTIPGLSTIKVRSWALERRALCPGYSRQMSNRLTVITPSEVQTSLLSSKVTCPIMLDALTR